MTEEPPDKHPVRSLAFFLAAGIVIFVGGLFAVLTSLKALGGVSFDSSVLDFYPVLAGLGALFGFSLWMSFEAGPSNPFHDR